MKKKTKALPPQPCGHEVNVGDIVYVAMADTFARVTAKYYRFAPKGYGRQFETENPKDFNPRIHRRENDLLTVQSLEEAFERGRTVAQYDSFHVHLADVSFRCRFVYDAVNAVSERLNRLAKKVGVA
jgi:hypothetical protein